MTEDGRTLQRGFVSLVLAPLQQLFRTVLRMPPPAWRPLMSKLKINGGVPKELLDVTELPDADSSIRKVRIASLAPRR